MSEKNRSMRLELLRLSRELAIGDYNNRRADLHNQWVLESDKLWRTSRMRLAYPPIPSFPTEEEIVERAKLLMDFVGLNEEPELESDGRSEGVDEPVEQMVPNLPEEKKDVLPSVLRRIEKMRSRLEDSMRNKNEKL